MPKSLNEIADELDQAQDALDLLGQGVGGAKGKAEIFTDKGVAIDLRQLAKDLREHANA